MSSKDALSRKDDLKKVAAEVSKAALPYKKYSLAPKYELAKIYLDELGISGAEASARAAAIRIAAALELLHIGVDHHYRNQGSVIKAFLETGASLETGSDRKSGASRKTGSDRKPGSSGESGSSRKTPPNQQGSEVTDIDLAIGDHFYASAIKEIASLGLINVIEASASALTRISSGYRTFDVLLKAGEWGSAKRRSLRMGSQRSTDLSVLERSVQHACESCGWLFYLAHQLACMPAQNSPAFLLDKTIEKQLKQISGIWFRKEIGLELPDLERDRLNMKTIG